MSRWRIVSVCLAVFSGIWPNAGQAQETPCVMEDALSEAAVTLLLEDEIDSDTIRGALIEAGSDLRRVGVLRAALRHRNRLFHRATVRTQDQPGELVCGEAQSGERIVLLFSKRVARLEGTGPRSVRAHFGTGIEDAYLAVQADDGHAERHRVRDGEEVRFELEGPLSVQLVGADRDGPRPLASLRLGPGSSLSSEPRSEIPAEDGVALERNLSLDERVRRLRAAHDLSRLRVNRILSRESERHARRVCAERRASHISGGDPSARLASRGIRSRVTGEVIARGASTLAAFRGLLESPSHRMALLDRRFTDVGLAEIELGGQTCVVVTLSAWPRYIPQ